ncbi:helix-turn-helix domain-containing protein [Actinacidiphila rubida]|uniref:Transcriptional regulator, contains XRE-family HTH domain n=1 Tax=Actinacidiphila rubida TaxID=310780 RepID=A0A1H8HUJ6_9ACTN|nr:helix-turn-helix transcriptional regulator [Actinacidiphila rubida]SEN59348.1 Transcriptional regulator, contains XRE-family HTH domain [Actinacidiphila rubida]
MAPTPRELKPASSAGDLFGAEQRRLRVAAGLSLDRLAEIVNYSKSHLHGVEVGERRLPLPPLPEKLDAAFGTGILFTGLWQITKRERVAVRFDACLELESRAVRIQEYGANIVPGLLQTEAYMRALFEKNDELSSCRVDELVAKRLARQERLHGDNPPDLWAIIDEAVLQRAVGGVHVMRDQLAALLPLADTPRTTIQVVPFSIGGYPIMSGSAILLTLPDNSTTAYQEGAGYGEAMDGKDFVARRMREYDRIKACAASPSDSAALIQAALEKFTSCEPAGQRAPCCGRSPATAATRTATRA